MSKSGGDQVIRKSGFGDWVIRRLGIKLFLIPQYPNFQTPISQFPNNLKRLVVIFVFLLLSVSPSHAAYVKEYEVEVLTTAGAIQSSAGYEIIGTLAQPTPLYALSSGYIAGTSFRVYPGYISNLNSRIIARYELNTQDTNADIDDDEKTQVAGVYFPLTASAYDGFGYIARSDSGTVINLTGDSSSLNFESGQLSLTQGQASTNLYGIIAGKYSAEFQAGDTSGKNALLSLADLEIKPAWINKYTLSATSPQKQGLKWSERVFSWDAYGNLVKAWDYLTVHFNQADVTLNEAAGGMLCSLEFYPDLDSSSSSATENYTLEKQKGRAFAYLTAAEAGIAQVFVEGQAYTYDLGVSDPGAPAAFSIISNSIIILPIGWLIDAQFVYDYASGQLNASGWLEKDGELVNAGLGGASLFIYDTQGTLLNTIAGVLDAQSIYQFSWPGASLTGHTYFARLQITYDSTPRSSDFSFSIDPVYQFTQTISQQLLVNLPQIETALEDVVEEVSDELIPYTQQIRDDAARILVAGEKTLPLQIKAAGESLAGLAKSGIFNTSTLMQQGKEYLVNFQTYSGVFPVLDVYAPDGSLVMEKQAMQETENSGVYHARIELKQTWESGAYTLVCSEATHGTMDALSVSIKSSDFERISRDISSILGTTSGLQDLNGLFDEIMAALDALHAEVEQITKQSMVISGEAAVFSAAGTQERGKALDRVYVGLLEIERKLEQTGLIPSSTVADIISFDESKKTDIDYLKQKFVQVDVLVQLHHQILDTFANEPVVQVWYEFR